MHKYFSFFFFLFLLGYPEFVSGSNDAFSNVDGGTQQQSLNFSTHQPINSSTHHYFNSSTHQPINSSTHHYFNSSSHQAINLQLTIPRWDAASASATNYQPLDPQLSFLNPSTHQPSTFNLSTNQPLSKDSLKTKDTVYTHKWKTATIWSACLPGAGQIYNEIGYRRVANKKNRAWWKVPIIYGALGATGYFFYQNTITARALKTEWLFREANPNQLLYEEYYDWDNDQLLRGKNFGLYVEPGFDIAAKRRDLLAFGFIAIWGLQVVEALVDGHFVHFDISQDLSFSWTPTMLDYSTMGVALKLDFD